MNFKSLYRKKPLNVVLQQGGDGEEHSGLHKVLTVRDLTFFGIAAIIGAGSFTSMGKACLEGGPGVIFLFIICAIACGFTAMCYAEFAARVPVSGSAYTYAYVSFGELFAWIIGWALLMEYSIGNIYVAFAWSGYFTNLLEGFGLHLPDWLSTNYVHAGNAYTAFETFGKESAAYLSSGSAVAGSAFEEWLKTESVAKSLKDGATIGKLIYDESAKLGIGEGVLAWKNAPTLAGLRIIFDLPAVAINILITYMVYVGTKESKNFSNLMVVIKLAIIVLVIAVGIFYIDLDNWTPFLPNGFSGVMAGVSAVFFAYIGFDAVSTLAEEAKNPQRDLPRGMIYSLIICTVIYIILALVLTGMVPYTALGVSDPMAEIFALKGVKWMLFIVSIAAVVAMTSVMLVFQMGQPRIWMTMSRDGLLPKRFSKLHPKYKTPGFATIVTGFVVGIPMFFTDETFILDFTSIGTLFAFVLVCGGVLMLPDQTIEQQNEPTQGRFRIPYINARYYFPPILVGIFTILIVTYPDYFKSLLEPKVDNIPMLVFFVLCIIMTVLSIIKNLSLIPVLGLVSCCYLLTGMAASNWLWFSV
jgi:amino acid transporter